MIPNDVLILIRQFRGERNSVLKQQLTSYIDPKIINYFTHVNPVLLSDEICYIQPNERNLRLNKIVAMGTLKFEYNNQQNIQTLNQNYWTLRELIIAISEIEINHRINSEHYDFNRIFLSNATLRYVNNICILTPEWTV